MLNKSLLITVTCLALTATVNALAEVINIPDDHQTIQAGINASNDGDVILLQEGTYYENLDFNGRNVMVSSLFVIDGDKDHIARTIVDGRNQAPVGLFNEEEGYGAGFEGLTLQNGRSDYGGAVKTWTPGFGRLSHATLRYCRILNSTASHGGAIYCHAGIRLYYCEIIGNAGNIGGSMEGSGDIILDHCLFYNNRSVNQGSSGGAFLVHYGRTQVINSTFYGNTGGAQLRAGNDALLQISNSIIWGDRGIQVDGNAFDTGWIRYSCLQDGENGIDNDVAFDFGDGNITSDPEFIDLDNGNFYLTENSPCIDAADPDSPEDPDGTRADMGANYYRQLADINILLEENWNLISINVIPSGDFWIREEGPDVIRMTDQIRIDENHHHLLIIKNEVGQFYMPAFDFNTIPYWNLTESYMIKVDAQSELIYQGEPIPAETEIPLEEGWNYIAYYPTYELDASAPDFYVLSPIIEHVEVANDINGLFLAPTWRFSNMLPWCQTQGYRVKVDQDVVLNYPAEHQGEALAGIEGTEKPSHLTGVKHTGNNMSVLVNAVTGIENGQIVAVTITGTIFGAGTVDPDGRCGLAVWGDDLTTEAKDGLTEGESFRLMLCDTKSELEVKTIHAGKGLVYETNSLLVIDAALKAEIPDNYYLNQNYPNPFNNATRISYGLPEAGLVSVKIYDLSGRVVQTLINGQVTAGHHAVEWNAGQVSSGLYLLQLEASNFRAVRKVVFAK